MQYNSMADYVIMKICFHSSPFPFQTSNMGHKGPILSYRQRQVDRHTAQQKRRVINADIDSVIDHVDREAKRLSIQHTRSLAWFRHQFYQGGRMVRQKPAVSVFNAAQQIDGFLEGCKGGRCSHSYILTHS